MGGDNHPVGKLTTGGTVSQTRFADITDQTTVQATQGAAADSSNVWISGGGGSTPNGVIHELDKADLSFVQEVEDVVPDSALTDPDTLSGVLDQAVQTVAYHNGSLYLFCREPQVHRVDASTLTYAGESWYQVVPEGEYAGADVFEGIARYDGSAFSNPKWFVNWKGGDNGIARLDDTFSYEKTYRPQEIDSGERDGISVFDVNGETVLALSITSVSSQYPGMDIYTYDSENDQFDYVDRLTVESDQYKTAEEGFSVVSPSEVYVANRYPYGDSSSTYSVAVSEQDWSNIIEQ